MAATTIGYRPNKEAIANDKKMFKERNKKGVQGAKKPKTPKEPKTPADTSGETTDVKPEGENVD